jgi:hypothetical protein
MKESGTAERRRLREDARREENWKRWGPYLAERQWATVREDYSYNGDSWAHFPHDHARSRAYRWGEDGLLGICDRKGRLCFALALWNERDPILKERLFGLTGPEGNHGEDVKECYWYLDATPTSSYLKALYRYPQAEFPYARLLEENAKRGREAPEFELLDSGVFDDGRYFDVYAEYAKASPRDILVRITVQNHAPQAAPIQMLPTLWFHNTWSWGRSGESYPPKPRIEPAALGRLRARHAELGTMVLCLESGTDADLLFTENETNSQRLFGVPSETTHTKDAIHRHVIERDPAAVNPDRYGTKATACLRAVVPAGGRITWRLRLVDESEAPSESVGADFERVFDQRIQETQSFYESILPPALSVDERVVARQAYAGLLWSKQSYHYVVREWLDGDPAQPTPPPERTRGRNHDWRHVHCRDVLSVPDTWEYPWFAAWDLAFQALAFARLDPDFAKQQLQLLLREWYMHPNGQIPAYEFGFGDANPPVHAWAAWRVYKASASRGERDRKFLAQVFHKLLLNFTWWVNRKDKDGNHLFAGGFLGLDNIAVFDRSQPLPDGAALDQADATAWMAFYCGSMLSMALELAAEDAAYEGVASKFLEHYVAIVDAMNRLGGEGLWDDEDGFYYDRVHTADMAVPLRVRSLVGLVPLFAVEVLEERVIDRLPEFSKRLRWFLRNRSDLAAHVTYAERSKRGDRLLAVPSERRLRRVLRYVFDEGEFLSPYGIRSLSRVHAEHPHRFGAAGCEFEVRYVPGESDSGLFGGNSNWRGPIWFPMNYLLIEALERYHHFYGDAFEVEVPTGSARRLNLRDAAHEIARRLTRLFIPDADGTRPCHGDRACYAEDPHWRDLLLFHEYFNGDTGKGLGASHQTGWTALTVRLLEDLAAAREVASAEVASIEPREPLVTSPDPTPEFDAGPRDA